MTKLREKMIIKVCGMYEPENIRAVEALHGVDLQGFIFYLPSPRCISGNKEVVDTIRKCGKKTAGVFVNARVDDMLEKANLYRLDYLQLHGSESPDICSSLRTKGYGVIKSFPVGTTTDFGNTDNYRGCVDYLLFDTKSAVYGGSGKRFDWSLLNEYNGETPFLLSGGLSPDCLQDILLLRHPRFAGTDINSGFEISAGIKDVEMIKTFVKGIIK
jgi:phosphoribosylanthranilate isomerase